MKTQTFLKQYLYALDFSDDEYILKISEDVSGELLVLVFPNDHPKIGVLKGRGGRNLLRIKQLLRVVGLNDKINPFLVVKLVEPLEFQKEKENERSSIT